MMFRALAVEQEQVEDQTEKETLIRMIDLQIIVSVIQYLRVIQYL